MPRHSRRRICHALRWLRTKRLEKPWKKHGNIPL
jgi:propionyl-CoA carboxylase beta subunit